MQCSQATTELHEELLKKISRTSRNNLVPQSVCALQSWECDWVIKAPRWQLLYMPPLAGVMGSLRTYLGSISDWGNILSDFYRVTLPVGLVELWSGCFIILPWYPASSAKLPTTQAENRHNLSQSNSAARPPESPCRRNALICADLYCQNLFLLYVNFSAKYSFWLKSCQSGFLCQFMHGGGTREKVFSELICSWCLSSCGKNDLI